MSRFCKLFFLITLASIACCFVCCSSVDEEEYLRVKNYNQALSTEINLLKKEHQTIKDVLNTATEEVEAAGKNNELCSKEMQTTRKYLKQLETVIAKDVQQKTYLKTSEDLRKKKELYVYHENGLKLFTEADQSETLDTIPYAAMVKPINYADFKVTVFKDGILGHMMQVNYKDKTGFVFNGFLGSLKPREIEEDLSVWVNRVLPDGKKQTENEIDPACKSKQVFRFKDQQYFKECKKAGLVETEIAFADTSLRDGHLFLRHMIANGDPKITVTLQYVDVAKHLKDNTFGISSWSHIREDENSKTTVKAKVEDKMLHLKLISE